MALPYELAVKAGEDEVFAIVVLDAKRQPIAYGGGWTARAAARHDPLDPTDPAPPAPLYEWAAAKGNITVGPTIDAAGRQWLTVFLTIPAGDSKLWTFSDAGYDVIATDPAGKDSFVVPDGRITVARRYTT